MAAFLVNFLSVKRRVQPTKAAFKRECVAQNLRISRGSSGKRIFYAWPEAPVQPS